MGRSRRRRCARKLTEDEEVFAVIGFFQDDAVLCPIGVHETAAIGGVMTQERFDQAAAPWFTTESGEDSDIDAVAAMAEAGQLDGKLGVYASILSESQLPAIEAKLDELGIEPVDSAVLDAPQDDITAQNQATGVIAERFKSKGIDKILVVGSAAVPIANGFAPLDYRPQLLFTSRVSVEAYMNGNDPDVSMFEDAVLGAIDNEVFEEDAMQDCLALVEDAIGEDIPDPDIARVQRSQPVRVGQRRVPQHQPVHGDRGGGRQGPELRQLPGRRRGPRRGAPARCRGGLRLRPVPGTRR